MASKVSFPNLGNAPTHPATPAYNRRRLSNFHKRCTSPSKGKQTPATPKARISSFHRSDHSPVTRTPLRPFNRHTPARTPCRQSFVPKSFHGTPRTSPQTRRHDQRAKQPQLTRAEIAQMYSSTIKLCQDNKINARNTWALNLIDYMSMLVKDEEESDNVSRTVSFQDDSDTTSAHSSPTGDTNFQLAGVTLDAGVKIYCSRVDSVHTNAFKVLGGLSRTGTNHLANSDDESETNNESADPSKRRQRSAKRTGRSTLETNLAVITSQKLETDLAVDPLFQKMSAAFDEGGAKGMLMNNLPVGPYGQILFDSSEPAEEPILLLQQKQDTESCSASDSSMCDISNLLPKDIIDDCDGLCPTFLSFYNAKRQALGGTESMDSGPRPESSSRHREKPQSDVLVEADPFFCDEDHDFDYDDGDLQNAGELGVYSVQDPGHDLSSARDDDEVELLLADEDNNRRHSVNSNISMAAVAQRGGLDLVEAGVTLQGNSSYSFFDLSSLSGWAGPQHWRFRAMTASTLLSLSSESKDGRKKTKRPRGKTAMLLDFYSDAPDVDFAKEFEPGKTEATHQLSSSVRDGFSEKKVTLPEDLHYSIRNLAGLFLKPGTAVKAKTMWEDRESQQLKTNDGDEWYDFENDCDNENFCSTEFNDSSGNGDDQCSIANANDSEFDMELIDEPTRVEKIDITYAKVAKKVDVRQLKSGLWSKLCGEDMKLDTENDCNETGAAEPGNANVEVDSESTDIRQGASQRLQTIVSEMTSFVPSDSLSDISLPYVFICLLHLANEKSLKINQASTGSLTDLTITTE